TDGLMSCLATATTVTPGGGGGASACWSWRPHADTHATAIAVVTTRQRANTRIVLPRLAHPNGQTNRLRGPDLPSGCGPGPEGYAGCMVQCVAVLMMPFWLVPLCTKKPHFIGLSRGRAFAQSCFIPPCPEHFGGNSGGNSRC